VQITLRSTGLFVRKPSLHQQVTLSDFSVSVRFRQGCKGRLKRPACGGIDRFRPAKTGWQITPARGFLRRCGLELKRWP